MKYLWLSWKDVGHPKAGGAEVVLDELSRRLVADGHEVTILTAMYPGGSAFETVGGVTYIRIGRNRYTHPLRALLYYLRRLRGQFDVVIEVVNTAPYLSVLFGRSAKRLLLYHQLAREVWFHEMPAGLSHVGYYAAEPTITRLLAESKVPTIAMSESTKNDLVRFGFRDDLLHILPQGIVTAPIGDIGHVKKYDQPTMLSFGTLRSMKRTIDQIRAFELAKLRLPDLQLKIAGLADGDYGKMVLAAIAESPFKHDITYLGAVAPDARTELMQRSHLITVTSVKEGWGLIVSEAASQGTPAVVYDVDGLRDSVRHNQTGLVVPTDPEALADGIIAMLTDEDRYATIRRSAWQWSKELTFDKSYDTFTKVVEAV